MRLRVATFNVENLDEKRKGVSLTERIAVLRPQLLELRADVLCLQECSARATHHGIHELRALDRLVDGTPYASFERATTKGASGGPSDKHNLVVLSRLPITSRLQHWHDLVEPPVVQLTTTPAPRDEHVRWDRPVLEVTIACPDGRSFDLRRPPARAARVGHRGPDRSSPFVEDLSRDPGDAVWRADHVARARRYRARSPVVASQRFPPSASSTSHAAAQSPALG